MFLTALKVYANGTYINYTVLQIIDVRLCITFYLLTNKYNMIRTDFGFWV